MSFVKAVIHGLLNQRIIGYFDISDDIFLATRQLRKYGCQQIFTAKALERWRNFFAIA